MRAWPKTMACIAAMWLMSGGGLSAQTAATAKWESENDSFPLSKHHAVFEKYEKIQASPNFSSGDYSQAYVVTVGSQKRFNRLPGLIRAALSKHDKVLVKISEGTYTFGENHIDLTDADFRGKKLYILGTGDVRIIGASAVYSLADKRSQRLLSRYSLPCDSAFSHTTGYTDGSKLVAVASTDNLFGGNLIQAETLFERVDTARGIARIRVPRELSSLTMTRDQCRDIRINYTEWFRGVVDKVDSIGGGYVYFFCSELRKGYNTALYCNGDYGFSTSYYKRKAYPRYRLMNIDVNPGGIVIGSGRINIPYSCPKLYECRNTTFIKTQNTRLAELDISGITFLCNGGGDTGALMSFGRSEADMRIAVHDNRFIGIKSTVVLADTPGVSVYGNRFTHSCVSSVKADNNASRICVFGNRFDDCNERLNNYSCVRITSRDYYVARNTFHNFKYMAIGVGVWYGLKVDNQSRGIVEFNKIYCDDDYLASSRNRGLMDSGAISTWTCNDGAIIRYNWIYNYGGAGANRGIFLDDGTYGAAVYGNVIGNVSYSLAIDLRYVDQYEKFTPRHNENNVIMYNIMDGGYRYHGKKGVETNILGRNIIVCHDTHPCRQLKNLGDAEDDFVVNGEIRRDYIRLFRDYFVNGSALPISHEISDKIIGGGMIKRYMEEDKE